MLSRRSFFKKSGLAALGGAALSVVHSVVPEFGSRPAQAQVEPPDLGSNTEELGSFLESNTNEFESYVESNTEELGSYLESNTEELGSYLESNTEELGSFLGSNTDELGTRLLQ